MEDLDFVKKILGGTYTIVQAALLINGEDPLSTVRIDQIEEERKKQLFLMTVSTIKNDIISRTLSADIFFDKSSKRPSGYLGLMKGEGIDLLAPRSNNVTSVTHKDIDENHTTIKEADLLKWLEDRDIRPPFFFPNENQSIEIKPEYMNPDHKNYSMRLHAAVSAWEAMTDETLTKNKNPKDAMTDWIQDNFKDLSLNAAKEAAAIANWFKDGFNNKRQ